MPAQTLMCIYKCLVKMERRKTSLLERKETKEDSRAVEWTSF